VHGITDEQLSTAPTFAEVYPALKRAIEGKVVVIYNKEYDKRILHTGYRLAGLPKISVTGYRCAMVLYAEYYGEWSARYEDYKFQALRGDHTAIGDCRAVLDILHRMAQDDAALTRWAALKAQLDRLHERQRELEPR
jgi:DNA polymerase-3 subunit epsilon